MSVKILTPISVCLFCGGLFLDLVIGYGFQQNGQLIAGMMLSGVMLFGVPMIFGREAHVRLNLIGSVFYFLSLLAGTGMLVWGLLILLNILPK